jgi:DNA-directed RNA polymerase subunit beta
MVDMKHFVDFDPEEYGVTEQVRFDVLRELLSKYSGPALKDAVAERIADLIPKHIIVDDIMASINYLCCLSHGIGATDDIDHLGNRRLRCVGELLQNQFRIGFSRMERVIRERMTIQDLDIVTPQSLINIRPVTAAIKEFFGSSPLSQFMDQTNPLAELTHKRRMSALGPGGLSRDRASFDVRDVHYSHYGRMCPIETPEGPNIVDLLSASYARTTDTALLRRPIERWIRPPTLTDEIEYMTADIEDNHFAQATEPTDETLPDQPRITAVTHRLSRWTGSRGLYRRIPQDDVSIAPPYPVSENDDANRALMAPTCRAGGAPAHTETPIVPPE